MGKYAIVDAKDNIIGFKKHSDILKSDIYRVSVLWVTNSKKQTLLAKRALNKSHDPSLWEPAVAGTVEIDETYRENIIKEAQEEIGLKIDENNLIRGPELFLKKDTGWQFFCHIFLYNTDMDISDFKIQHDEVLEINWFNLADLKELMDKKESMLVSNFDKIFYAIENYKKVDII